MNEEEKKEIKDYKNKLINIPKELKACPNWVCYMRVMNEKKGKYSKIPVDPKTLRGAKSNDPTTWDSYENAKIRLGKPATVKTNINGKDSIISGFTYGLGFMFSNSEYFGIDLDDCDNEEGQALIKEFTETLESYTEYSPSGKGIHIICKGHLPSGAKRKDNIKMYESGHFFTMTGNIYKNYTQICDCTDKVKQLYDKYLNIKKEQNTVNKRASQKKPSETNSQPITSYTSNATQEAINRVLLEAFGKQELPEGNRKYIFVVSDKILQEFIIEWGYFSLCIDEANQEEIFKNLENFSKNLYINNYTFLLSSTKKLNTTLNNLLREIYSNIKIDNNAWTLFKNINSAYFTEQDKELLQGKIENYIKKYTTSAGYFFERDETDDKIKVKGLNYEKFAKYVIEKYNIFKIEDALHYYKEGLYIYLSGNQFDGIMMEELHNSKIKDRKEFYEYIKHFAESKERSPSNYILFNNGVYDLNKDILLPFSKEYVFTNIIPHNYNKNPEKSELFETFLSNLVCQDVDVIKLLKQAIGYTFYRHNPLQEFFFILGNGGNGKSTFVNFMAYLIGEDNTSYLTTEDMENNFNLPALKNKLLNIGDDIENKYIERVGVLKKIVTGERFLAGLKYKDKEPMYFYGKALFTGNAIPKMNDKTNGMKRRLNILPFLNNFVDNPNSIFNIDDKIQTEEVAEYVIKIGVEHLKDLLRDKKFIKPDIVKKATDDYTKKNNHIVEFIEEYPTEILEKTCQTLYSGYYKNFCIDCGYKPLGRNEFYSRMELEGYKRVQLNANVNPKRPRMFKKIK